MRLDGLLDISKIMDQYTSIRSIQQQRSLHNLHDFVRVSTSTNRYSQLLSQFTSDLVTSIQTKVNAGIMDLLKKIDCKFLSYCLNIVTLFCYFDSSYFAQYRYLHLCALLHSLDLLKIFVVFT